MPRNESGVYSLPSGSIVSDGEEGIASQHNSPLQDLAADANLARPVVTGGTGATSLTGARANLGLMAKREFTTVADFLASTETDYTSGDRVSTLDEGYAYSYVGTSGGHVATAGGRHFDLVHDGVIHTKALGSKDDDSTDNQTILETALQIVRDGEAKRVVVSGRGVVRISGSLFAPSFCDIEIEGTLRTTRTNGAALWLGRMARQDIARIKGVEEKAHSLGTLSEGDVDVTIGQRWNNTAESFSNSADYTPLVGDRVIVCTTDNTSSDDTRPVPSYTLLRRIVEVDGSDVRLDKGVRGDGTYMLAPVSRDLGYDRVPYGGLTRMHCVEQVKVRGRIIAPTAYALNVNCCIDPDIDVSVEGYGLHFGNATRGGKCVYRGTFYENIEIKLGSEDFDITCIGNYRDVGRDITTACLSVGERAIGGKLHAVIDGQGWANDTGPAVRLDVDGLHVERLHLSCDHAGAGLLINGETPGSGLCWLDDVDFRQNTATNGRFLSMRPNTTVHAGTVRLAGSTSSDVGVTWEGGGSVRSMEVVDNSKVVSFTGDVVVGRVTAPGTVLLSENTRVDSKRLWLGRLNQFRDGPSYASSYTPTKSFEISLSGDMELQTPSGTFEVGDQIAMIFFQSGARELTFASGSLYRGIAAPGTGASSAQRFAMTVEWSGTVWVCVATNGGWV